MNIDQAAEIAYGPNWKEKKKERKIVNALQVARRYVRTVEAWRGEEDFEEKFDEIIKEFTTGDEEKILNDALLEFGIIF